uniref:DNA 3'-5' helicase n=1 Tax=Myotis daubentonii polyomavirus TaxID=3139990 RepID=A0AAU6S4Y8_9POLY
MMLLNSLWHKYQEGVIHLRSFPEVRPGTMDLWDFSLEDCYSLPVLKDLMLKGPHCLCNRVSVCSCITSSLINQHHKLKERCNKKCLVWGECFCIFCFTLWYGMAYNWETFEVWAATISQMPKSLLLLNFSKYISFSLSLHLVLKLNKVFLQVFTESYGTPFFRARYEEWARRVFTHERPTAEPDLYCDESSASSSDEEPGPSTSRGTSTPEPESSGYDSFPNSRPFTSTPTTQEESTPSFGESEHSQTSSPDRSRRAENEPSPKRRRHGENVDGSYPSSQASFASTPPKEKAKMSDSPTDLPACLFDFVSHAVFSNKTTNSFIIYSTVEKTAVLYDKIDKFKIEYKSLHQWEEGGGFLLMLTTTRHRLSAIKSFCQTFCTVSFLVCKVVLKPLDLYRFLCKPPFSEIKSNRTLCSTDFEDKGEDSCNWNKVAEFAVEADLDDALLILAHYLDFAKPYPCPKCEPLKTQAHQWHRYHHENAICFEICKSQRSVCNQAADVVLAKRRLLLAESTRNDILTRCFQKQLEKLKKIDEGQIMHFMAGVAWYACLFDEFDVLLYKILKLFTENVPKRRNVLFRGPVNTGKTTLAAALIDLLDGKSLNVNCPADKLNFELGCAIDRFVVSFEDVKGQNLDNKRLPPGQGIANLDNMRDYLDGAVPVNLERKHVNKKSQIFPPCIVTMNEYFIPETLFVRMYMKLNFTNKPHLHHALEKTPVLCTDRILQSGLTLFLLLMWYFPSSKFSPSLREEIKTWKEIVEKTVSHETFCKMLENVEVGESPLAGILDYESEDDI